MAQRYVANALARASARNERESSEAEEGRGMTLMFVRVRIEMYNVEHGSFYQVLRHL